MRAIVFPLALFFLLSMIAVLCLARAGAPETFASLLLTNRADQLTAHASVDPNQLVDPATYDSRPCRARPSASACNGLYPVTPQHVSQSVGNQHGAGACLDRSSKAVETQPLIYANGSGVGQLTLYWLPSCRSSFAVVTFAFPLTQVSSLEIWVQTEYHGWLQQLGLLPVTPQQIEQTGPVSGNALTGAVLYSPLIYAPSDPVSASINLQLQGGTEFGNVTGSYLDGIFQYRA